MAKTDAQNKPENAFDPQSLLSVDAVASILSVSSKTVRRMIERGALRTCRVGRLLRVKRADLAHYIACCGVR